MAEGGAPSVSFLETLAYPSNVVGYLRLALVGTSGVLHLHGARWTVVCVLAASGLLDLVDGELARKYEQVSRFGTAFDQLLDLTTHTLVWILSGFPLAIPLLLLEWGAGLAVLNVALFKENHWKSVLTDSGPAFIRRYFANRQRNWLSAVGCVSHFAFPMSLYLGFGGRGWALAGLPGLILYEAVTAYMLFALFSPRRCNS